MGKITILTGVIGTEKGGMSLFAVNLFKLLDPEKFDVTFLSRAPHPYFEREILDRGGHIACIASRNRHPLRHRRDLDRIMREGRFDVCHIHLASASNIEPLAAAKRAGIPLVIAHSHCSGLSGGKLSALLHRLNAPKIRRYSDLRLACSGLAGEFLYDGADFSVVKNAIDLGRFAYSPETRERMRKSLGLEGKFVLGHVGRLAPEKNPRFLLETFAEIKKLEPSSALVSVGDGPLRGEMEELAVRLGIAEDVIFAGQVLNPEDYLCAFDCFLLPSLYEGLGFVVIEAVCSGLRCFASDVLPREAQVGGMVELFPLDADRRELAERILESRQDPASRSGQGALLASAGYDAASLKRRMEAIYAGQKPENQED